MLVKMYEYTREGHELPHGECELIEVFGDGAADPEYQLARNELAKAGRYWLGGGAAPLILLKRAA